MVTPHTDVCLCGQKGCIRHSQAKDTLTGEYFQIWICNSCGLAWTSPRPADPGHYYGSQYHGGRHGLSARFCRWRRLRVLSRACLRAGRILDVGCGDGSFMRALQNKGWEASGIELDAQTRVLQAAGLDVRDSITKFELDMGFQAITLWHSLEHMQDPAMLLKELRTRISPTGSLIIAVPDAAGIQAQLFATHWLHLDVPRHLWHFNRTSLEHLLQEAGFIPTWFGHQELEFDMFGWVQSSLNLTSRTPNNLFHALTGKPYKSGNLALLCHAIAAISLTPIALAATFFSALLKRGGTLVAIAKPSQAETLTAEDLGEVKTPLR